MIVVMMAFASVMERFIERPFRTVDHECSTRSLGMRFAFLIILFATITHTAFLQNGWARGQEVDRMLERIRDQFPSNVSLLKPADRFCDGEYCPVVKDGEWLFIDQGHFSVAGSIYMVQRASAEFRELIRTQLPLPN